MDECSDTEIVRAINVILDDYADRELTAQGALVAIARCTILRDVSR